MDADLMDAEEHSQGRARVIVTMPAYYAAQTLES